MIVQYVLNFFSRTIAGLIGFFPALPSGIASGLSGLPGNVQTVMSYVGRLDPILPLAQVQLALQLVLAGWTFYLLVMIARQIVSFATGGGGNA